MAAKKRTARNKKGSKQVPGQYYGYSLQTTRALAHLIGAGPGMAVSVEHLDDVATVDPSANSAVYEQDKSGLAHNPVADRSIELWKTLHAWVDVIRDGALVSDTRFVLYVAQQHDGSVLRRLNEAQSVADAGVLVDQLRDEFWGPAPTFAKMQALPDELAKHVTAVLQASDAVLQRLIVNFSCLRGSGSPLDEVEACLGTMAIGDGALEDVSTFLLGWTKRSIDKAIESDKPAVLMWDEFHKQLVAAARKFDRSGTLTPPPALEVTKAQMERELRGRVYVNQLKIVSASEDDVVSAVSDFLRASFSRTAWSEKGDVVEDSFKEFENDLTRAWRNLRGLVDVEHSGRPEVDRGKLLLLRCLAFRTNLQSLEVPAYFVPGSFHALAEAFSVGWHPRFVELLRSGNFGVDAATTGWPAGDAS